MKPIACSKIFLVPRKQRNAQNDEKTNNSYDEARDTDYNFVATNEAHFGIARNVNSSAPPEPQICQVQVK